MKKMLGAALAASLLAGSVAAQAAPVRAIDSRLNEATVERQASRIDDRSAQSGGFPFLIVFVVIAVGLGLYFAVEENDGEPNSPGA